MALPASSRVPCLGQNKTAQRNPVACLPKDLAFRADAGPNRCGPHVFILIPSAIRFPACRLRLIFDNYVLWSCGTVGVFGSEDPSFAHSEGFESLKTNYLGISMIAL